MKYLTLIILMLCFLTSCVQELIDIGCGETKYTNFTKSDSIWLPVEQEQLSFKNKTGNIIAFELKNYSVEDESDGSCTRPIHLSAIYYSETPKIQRVFVGVSRGEYNNGYHQISYSFSVSKDDLIPINSQNMGLIDIETNQPINNESNPYGIKDRTTKLGTHQIGEKTYNDVFLIEDLDKNNVPEIDIFRFYVNPSGILRIEFYDGEIWDRVD